MKKELGLRLTALLAVCVLSAAAPVGCKKTEKAESTPSKDETLLESTEHSEIYDATRHDCPQYQWFVMDASGKVLDNGWTMADPPEITETDGIVSVFVQTEAGKGIYREYTPETGGMSRKYERRSEGDNDYIYFGTETGEFVFPEVIEAYWEITEGVNRDSFVNYEKAEQPVTDADSAYERAANEVGKNYNAVNIDYDKGYDMWAVMFYNKDEESGSSTVYLDSSGITKLIISGE